MSNPSIDLTPVAGWEIRGVKSHGAVMFRIDFFANEAGSKEDIRSSRNFVLAADQCRELADSLAIAAERMDAEPRPGEEPIKH